MPQLQEYRGDIYSQNGEDGIIAEILVRLGIKNGYFVEFGAWDGIHLSNCRSLYDNGWSGCYIEGDPSRFEALKKSTPEDRISKICAFVRPEGDNSLDALLSSVNAPEDIDVLSIDIDSDDYAVWKGLTDHRAKVLIIEFNPTIPNACSYVQPEGANIGNSARALCELAVEKGCDLAAATLCNLIFVRREFSGRLRTEPQRLEDIREEFGFLFHAFDGRLIAVGAMEVNPWSRTHIRQSLPRLLRGYSMSRPRRLLKELYRQPLKWMHRRSRHG